MIADNCHAYAHVLIMIAQQKALINTTSTVQQGYWYEKQKQKK
jgi:hypothetical protein